MTRNEILKIIDKEIINKDENIDVDKLDEYLQLFESTLKILKIFKRKDELNFIKNVYSEISKIDRSFIYVEKRDIINTIVEQNWCHSIFKYYEKLKVWNVLEISLEKENSKLLFGIIPEGSDAIVLDKLSNNKIKFQNLFNNMELKNNESYLYYWYINAERCNDNDYAKEIADNILKLDNILSNL